MKDIDKLKVKFNLKSMVLYERMTQKSYFDDKDELDNLKVVYCALLANNDITFTFDAFISMLSNKKIAQWIENTLITFSKINNQFSIDEEEEENNSIDTEDEEEDLNTATKIASILIIRCGLDCRYVMYDMDLWEAQYLFKVADEKMKDDMEMQRLWTYLIDAPHIDGKKIKSPSELLPLPWEKDERKKKAEKELKNNEYAIKHTIGQTLNIP